MSGLEGGDGRGCWVQLVAAERVNGRYADKADLAVRVINDRFSSAILAAKRHHKIC